MNYKKINLIGGWVVFAIAAVVFLSTIEDTVSLWDCGEYITAAYKLEVGHPPGAPLFMLLGRLFSFFVSPEHVAQMINSMSALSSAFTILFMYWSISLLVKKIALKDSNRSLTDGQIIAIQGSALIGALVYTFSDSFWFSAVEGEVYAMSSLFTAIIFWAILKWDEESTEIKLGELVHHKSTHRWIILIMFLFGLAIGVHLLGLLVIPAIAYVIYFNKWENFNWKGFFIAGFIGIFTLGFIQAGVIPGTISLASTMEIYFVNKLGFAFNSGAIGFFVIVISVLIVGLIYTQRKGLVIFNTAILSFIVLIIGYGAFAIIVIRSNANTPLDENDPENLVSLHSYLLREQYGTWPIATGPYWNSKTIDATDRSPSYERMFVVQKNGDDITGFLNEGLAQQYKSKNGGEIVEKYFITNDGKGQVPVYEPEHTTILPRMFWNQDEQKIDGYKKWSGYASHGPNYSEKPSVPTTDGQRLPTFGENMRYLATYQVGWMYFRYFLWNFVGRQNDIQGHGDAMRGNWQSGISFIDSQRIGDQSIAPLYTRNNPSHNSFYFLPLILGLIGLIFHFYKAPKDAFIVLLLFLFTGLAIVIYLNQKPYEPRERDYAYAASFYAFAFWIGISVYALFDVMRSIQWKELKTGLMGIGSILVLFWFSDMLGGEYSGSLSWLFISIVSILMAGIMYLLKGKISEKSGAFVAIILTISAPIIMGIQGWDDHDRGTRTTALDLAKNYLGACEKNSVLFTNGDNDTFPLWYLQEVEEKGTSVRVCNLSLLQTDWYTEQMTMKAYDSDPLPISMTPDQMVGVKGKTDAIYFSTSYYQLATDFSTQLADSIFDMKIKSNQNNFNLGYRNAAFTLAQVISQTSVAKSNPQIIQTLMTPIENPGIKDFIQFFNVSLQLLQNGSKIGLTEEIGERIQKNITNLEDLIDYLPIKFVMDFALNDKNMVTKTKNDGGSDQIRIFPAAGFIIPVKDKDDLVKNHVIEEKMLSQASDEVRFRFTAGALYKDQIVMLDILSNFDWKRNIYFSSPYASEVGKALLQAGYISMEGTVYKLTPLKGVQINTDRMYENLMHFYGYGKMGEKGILVDYYTRRHTSQYRHYFYVLASQYAQAYMQSKSQGNMLQADSTSSAPARDDKAMQEARDKTIKVIEKAMTSMPLVNVIDYGEPNGQKQQDPRNPEDYTYVYSDGKVHEYVSLLYRVDAPEKAAELGNQVADRLESIMNFVLDSPISISATLSVDFFSALDAYSSMFASTPDGGNDPFEKRMTSYISSIQGRFNMMLKKMKDADVGKVREEKMYDTALIDYQDRMMKMPLFGQK